MPNRTIPTFVGMSPTGDAGLGRVQIAPEVLEVIIGIATTEVNGVANTSGSFATGVAEKFGKVNHGKGVKTIWNDEGLIIDIYCVIEYGYSVPAVASEIQQQVRDAVFHMTSLESKEVNIHITGMQFKSETETI